MNLKVTNILTKTAGAAGLALIAYDSHKAGKLESASFQKQVKAETLKDTYVNSMTLNSPSTIQAGLKKKIFNISADENISGFFTGIAGYIKGVASMAVDSVVPLALSAGAVIKNPLSKVCGIGLLAYGGIFLAQEILGIGKPKAL